MSENNSKTVKDRVSSIVAILIKDDVFMDLFGVVCFNCKTGKVATSVGLDLSWRCF